MRLIVIVIAQQKPMISLKIFVGRKVILLTATLSFNNTPEDILSLLSLFIIPKKSNITLSSNLSELFRSYNNLFMNLNYIQKNYQSTDDKNRNEAIKDIGTCLALMKLISKSVCKSKNSSLSRLRSIGTSHNS